MMAKKAEEKKETPIQKIRKENKHQPEEIPSIALNKCQAALERLYRTNLQAMNDLAKKTKEVESLQKKIDNFTKKEAKIVSDYLAGLPDLKSIVMSESNKAVLKKKAAEVKAEVASAGRKTWNAFSLVQELTKADHDDNGYVSFKALKDVIKAPNVDVLTKRLKTTTDELFKQLEKDGTIVEAKVSKDFKVIKKKGEKTFNYLFDKTKIIDRLQKTDEYKEEAKKVNT